jgi:hypothetical protein
MPRSKIFIEKQLHMHNESNYKMTHNELEDTSLKTAF